MTKELVVISQASRQIIDIAEGFNTSVIELHKRYQSELTQLHRDALERMKALIVEEPELLIDESTSEDGQSELA